VAFAARATPTAYFPYEGDTMDEEDNNVTVTYTGAMLKGKPVIILQMSAPQVVMSLENARSLLDTLANCIRITEIGYKKEKESGKTTET